MKKIIALMLCVMLMTGATAALAENWFASTEPATSAAAAVKYVNTTGNVNVRTGPGLGYGSLGSVTAGTSLKYLNETSVDDRGVAWYKVEFNMNNGWVSAKYAKLEGEASAPVVETKYVTATGNVNVRKGAGLDFSSMGTVNAGTSLKYLNETSVDDRGVAWFKVEFKNTTGWISSKYSKLDGDVNFEASYLRATAHVNVRSGPAGSYEDLGTLEKGEQVLYLHESAMDGNGDTWYKVQYYSYFQGWVIGKYAKLVTDDESGVPATELDVVGTYVKATGGKSTLRGQPNVEAKNMGTIQKGQTAEYLGDYSVDERGVTWYKVEFNGKIGWVSSRYTTLY